MGLLVIALINTTRSPSMLWYPNKSHSVYNKNQTNSEWINWSKFWCNVFPFVSFPWEIILYLPIQLQHNTSYSGSLFKYNAFSWGSNLEIWNYQKALIEHFVWPVNYNKCVNIGDNFISMKFEMEKQWLALQTLLRPQYHKL